MREIKVEEQIDAFNLAKSKHDLLETLQRVIEEPLIENVDEEGSQALSCSVRNAPFESIEENEPSVVPVVEPLLRSEESQQSLLGAGALEGGAATVLT